MFASRWASRSLPEPSSQVRSNRQYQQRTLTDDRSQVRHDAALAVDTATWLRDEEAAPVQAPPRRSAEFESYSRLGGCTSAMPRADAIGGWRSLS